MQVAKLRELVSRGRSDKALKMLYAWAAQHDDEILNNVIMLQGRLNSLERQANMGLLSSSDTNMERNRINYALLSTLGDLEDHPKLATNTTSASNASAVADPDSQPSGKKLFISYAREDREVVDKLELHLTPLIRSGLVSTWSDSQIRPGQQWSQAIKNNLLNADIVLFIVSANFLASDYINDHERVWARTAVEQHNAVIVPVIARPCLWELDTDLASRNAVPKHPKRNEELVPISDWRNEDEAYLATVKQLSKLLPSLISRAHG